MNLNTNNTIEIIKSIQRDFITENFMPLPKEYQYNILKATLQAPITIKKTVFRELTKQYIRANKNRLYTLKQHKGKG